LGNGLNFFTNAVDKTPAAKDSYQDVDVSGDGVPEGSSGVILEIQNLNSGNWFACRLRKNGSSFDNTNMLLNGTRVGGYAFVPVDLNRVFEAYVSSNVNLFLIGYTGSDVVYFDTPTADAPSSLDTWEDIDKSASIPAGATGIIGVLVHSANDYGGLSGIRCNGSTDEFPYGTHRAPYSGIKWQYCGLDANRLFEMKKNEDGIYFYIYAYTKGEVTFLTNGVEKSPTSASAWTDVDVTNETDANADGVLLMLKLNSAYGNYQLHARKNGSSDNRTTGATTQHSEALGTGSCSGIAIGLDSEQIYEAWIDTTTDVDVYVIGYNAPAGATLQTVADSLAVSESVLRNKALLPVSDSVGLADSLHGNKLLLLDDSASLSELVTVIMGEVVKYVTDSVNLVDLAYALKNLKISDSLTLVDASSTPSRVLNALDAVGATDNAVVNKVLQITETVSLAEIVEVGVGSAKKTKLFLILGDLAVQLTGD
jgi:hypothetical protein